MIIYPAIDIKDGKCVRLTRGDFDSATVYSEEPWRMAQEWQEMGAQWLHVVDLDGAKTGAPQNIRAVHEIIDAVNIPVQFGGGIRLVHYAEMMFTLGVSRVIVGTILAQNERLARKLFEQFGDKIAVGLDARNGKVAVKGWQEEAEESAVSFAKRMESLGARRIIYTDIMQDGTLEGVNVEKMREMCHSVSIPIIASGGVRSLEDVTNLKPLEESGLEGLIVGKSLYLGTFDLRKAVEMAASQSVG